MQQNTDWWRGAIIYQIYPRSFFDSNNDGIGDLPGVTEKLPYIASLGVDGIWLSPFFKSPMKDFGYDVSDYRAVDPMFGHLDDFKALLEKAHQLGLKILIDQVLSHTSDQHAWFQESRQNKTNPKADWYVWADAKPDGSPPNNWLSLFGGSAWQWDSRRHQYYLHNFLASQPDLNFHNEAVQQQMLEEVKFWLDLGVDGFRLDTVNFYVHSKNLEDNPPLPKGAKKSLGVRPDNPYSFQRHVYDICQPENVDFIVRLRQLLDQYPGTTTVGEIGADDTLQVMADYTSGGNKLHMAYTFDLLNPQHDAAYIQQVISQLEAQIGDGWPCWALSNHDTVRSVTRWGEGHPFQAFAQVSLAMLMSMRGSVCLYQGEELGLPEADVPFEAIQDPYGIPFWPEFKGRDGCRTPIPWRQNATNAGFSQAEPWLPIVEQHLPLAVSEQIVNPNSCYQFIRQFIQWRQQQPALRAGTIKLVEDTGEALVWWRHHSDQQLLVAVNLTADTLTIPLSVINDQSGANIEELAGHGFKARYENDQLILPPYQVFFGQLF
ncbi:DUF3459 domain-containing protein [Endozoicomonas sp. SM1973]|uniref:DUF3459 domain-containing protein n=1 Tax=Spartinivicinus marinus TaxID=2994442 RepID=A0A853IG28_9GAMM|nr:alpha-glucosidase [Spartinivicinus marinus]MCX4025910.1 alpha glucosidase [Spartinivicinus marinus]NYZ68095.1 DUF3459 domain-containing protein [Spartinivicinus marinus]